MNEFSVSTLLNSYNNISITDTNIKLTSSSGFREKEISRKNVTSISISEYYAFGKFKTIIYELFLIMISILYITDNLNIFISDIDKSFIFALIFCILLGLFILYLYFTMAKIVIETNNSTQKIYTNKNQAIDILNNIKNNQI